MALDRLLNVSRKEFTDHITSKRFIIIFGLLLVISTISLYEGIGNYNDSLKAYTEQLQYVEEVADPYSSWMPTKPSIMHIFTAMMSYMTMLGGILAIAIGFDLVSKEKETRSLKTLLSHPLYRDEIINGKALGGIGALGFAMVLAIAIAVAMLLLFSIIPTAEELVAILIFGAVSLGFLLAYFAVALAMSTAAKESGNALIYTLVIFFAVSSLLPIFGMMAGNAFAGDPPEPPEFGPMPVRVMDEAVGVSSSVVYKGMEDPEWKAYEEEMRAYYEKRRLISDVSNILSPQMNYQTVAFAVTEPRYAALLSSSYYSSYATPEETPGLADALGRVWMNIAALIVFPSAFFAIAYVKFMRMDIR